MRFYCWDKKTKLILHIGLRRVETTMIILGVRESQTEKLCSTFVIYGMKPLEIHLGL